MLQNGFVLDGKYEIIKRIGGGATSNVYLAMNPKLNQQWVIKEISKQNKVMKRVLREAKLMMGFDNPSIPRIVDILEKDQFTYIIMDYVSGQSLAFELVRKGPRPQDTVVEWGKQICGILKYLHSLNPPIIYHDLKPGNIILKEPEGNLKLIDFGEARPCINGDAPGGGFTDEYAAPEQKRETKGKTDQRTDIYCFGTTMYRLLAKEFPPKSPEPVGSIRERFPELNISKGMDNIIRKCTQKDPDKRFQSADELMDALEHISLWDEDYLKQQRRKLRVFGGTLLAAVILLAAGVGFHGLKEYSDSQTYETLVSTSTETDYEQRIENYLQAIELRGGDAEAYLKLVAAYGEDNREFGSAESQKLLNAYYANKSEFKPDDKEYLDLQYRMGKLYFIKYMSSTAYDDKNFSERILKAKPFFEAVKTNGAQYENYKMACSYWQLCEFFERFVLTGKNVKQATREDYEEMVQAVYSCVEDAQEYASDDAVYTRLTLYQKLLNMIKENAGGMKQTGLPQRDVAALTETVIQAAEKEGTTNKTTRQAQADTIAKGKEVKDALVTEYSSADGGEADG